MKLSRIPTKEASVKTSISLRKSSNDLLDKYHEAYEKTYGVEVTRQELIEHMLLGFMADDKAFQRSLRQLEADKPAAPEAPQGGADV